VIFATGAILAEAMAAAEMLAAEGASIRVVDVHTIKPLDIEAICDATRECGHVVTLEEHGIIGGLGGAVAEACLEGGTGVRSFRRIGLDDCYPDVVGDQDYLRSRYGLDRHRTTAALRSMLSR
jgi:transketolase